jgi:UDP-glucose 4-epimerase
MLNQGTRVLLTGGAGFIGAHLCRALAAAGAQVRVLDDFSLGKRERLSGLGNAIDIVQADVRHADAVKRAAQGAQVIVHLAGLSHGGRPHHDPLHSHEVSLSGALNVLQAARLVDKRTRPRVILCSSGSVYGKQSAFVLHEELVPHPVTPEAATALALEHYGRVYLESFGVPTVALRLFRVFGPEEDMERPDSPVVPRFVRAALEGLSPVVYGDGQQTRDFVFIDNVTAAIIGALVCPLPEGPINIASGESVTISFLWQVILEICGKRRVAIEPSHVPMAEWETRHARPQIARACKVLGWAPSIRLREGLTRTIRYYHAQRTRDPNAWFSPPEAEESARRRHAGGSPPRIPRTPTPIPAGEPRPEPCGPAPSFARSLALAERGEPMLEISEADVIEECDGEPVWAPVPSLPGLR